MHTFLYRTNSLLTFVASVLVVLCILASITDYFHRDNAVVAVNVSPISVLVALSPLALFKLKHTNFVLDATKFSVRQLCAVASIGPVPVHLDHWDIVFCTKEMVMCAEWMVHY